MVFGGNIFALYTLLVLSQLTENLCPLPILIWSLPLLKPPAS